MGEAAHSLLFGITVGGDPLPGRAPLRKSSDPAELVFERCAELPRAELGSAAHGASEVRFGEAEIEVDLSGTGRFLLRPDRIRMWPLAGVAEEQLEIGLLGSVFALWLESRGTPVFHASAVSVGAGAVAFCGTYGEGKTTLALAHLVAGEGLVTDDVLALEPSKAAVRAIPSYPQMRVTEEQARQLLGPTVELERLHPDLPKLRLPIGAGFGRMVREPRVLRAVVVPQRRRELEEPLVERLPLSEAVVLLARNSYLAKTLEAAPWARDRFSMLTHLAQRLEAYRLMVPEGLERIQQSVAALRSTFGD